MQSGSAVPSGKGGSVIGRGVSKRKPNKVTRLVHVEVCGCVSFTIACDLL